MDTNRQQANRENAQSSTGPRTPEGKARSSQNARKHGFASAKFSVVRLEELDALTNLRADAIAAFQPVNSQELFAVERIALAQLSLLRCAALEAGLHTSAMSSTMTCGNQPENLLSDDLTRDIPVARAQNRTHNLAIGFIRTAGRNDAWHLFFRYQAQTERLYRRAVEEFERLKALREELPNEPMDTAEVDPIPASELMPPTPPLTQDEIERRYAASIDPTFAIPSRLPPQFDREK